MNGRLVQWSDRMFGIVLFWFVKLLIIYRLLQQTSKIYGPSCTGQKYSTLKMVKFSFWRGSAKLFKACLAYQPSNADSGWFWLSGFLSVLSLLIVTRASWSGPGRRRAGPSSCEGLPLLLHWWDHHQDIKDCPSIGHISTPSSAPQNGPCRLFSAENDASRQPDKWSLSLVISSRNLGQKSSETSNN